MQLTKFIGKQVLSPAGENLGYVLRANPARDMKSVSCFLLVDDEEEEYYLPAKSVISSADALIASRTRISAPTGTECPLGKSVFSHTGEFLGRLCELIFGEDEPLFVVAGENAKLTLPFRRVALGDALVVFPEGMKKPAPAKAAPKKKPVAAKPKPESSPKEPAAAESSKPPVPAKATVSENAAPADERQDGEDALGRVNLLGRRVRKGVYDEFGFPIIEAGEFITESVVSRARRAGRLLQLAVNTLTNVY